MRNFRSSAVPYLAVGLKNPVDPAEAGRNVPACRLIPPDGIVLDPFLGSGTTAAVAKQMGRHYIGIELNPDYCALAEQRIGGVTE